MIDHAYIPALLKALLYGLGIWLLMEALFSAYLGVWFNVGLDIAVFAFTTGDSASFH
jgi:hypothetical protein